MANPDIGTVQCPFDSDCVGKVRQYSTGKRKYYYTCRHGMITPNLDAGQAWMQANMQAMEPEDQPEPEAESKPETKPTPKRKSPLAWLLEDDDE